MKKEILIENKALKEYLYDAILELIENGEIDLGVKINKVELANRFNVSQTPINDALNRLVGENYLYQESRKGYFVREYTQQEEKEFFEMRACLEAFATKLFCIRASDDEIKKVGLILEDFRKYKDENNLKEYAKTDRRFHEEIVLNCQNSAITNAMKTTRFISRTYQRGLVRGPELTFPEHEVIIDSIKKRNADEARVKMEEHLLAARNVFIEKIKEKEKNKLIK